MQQLHVDHRRGLSGSRARAENPGSAILQLCLPGDDLRRMHVKQLGQLGQRLLALDGGQRHLRLEAGAVGPAGSLRHGLY